jgi:hypothetical protein
MQWRWRLGNDEEWDGAAEQALNAAQALHSPERIIAQRQKPKTGDLEAKLESPGAPAAVPVPAKRPVPSASTKSGGRAVSSVVRDAPRPPAAIPEPSVLAVREP